ncbi:MAG: Fe-S cluster assembly protein SufD [Candidatus Eisenbacteria bacterium]|nr:Fe-S cluster assembly protein SufD [Candidatus Eisenbacteria bacterium]
MSRDMAQAPSETVATVVGGGLPASVRDAAQRRGEPQEVVWQRERAWDLFQQLALPERAAHLWRYTDPKRFVPDDDVLGQPMEPGAGPDHDDERFAATVILSGGECRITVGEDAARRGVRILDLAQALHDQDDLLEGRLGSLVPPEHGKFEALATALWRTGFALHVPRRVELEKPIRVVVASGPGSWDALRYAVALDEGARAAVIEEHAGTEEAPGHHYGIGELWIDDNARLEHVIIQRHSAAALAHLTYRTRLGAHSIHRPFVTAVGGKLIKIDTGTRLAGQGAETELLGLVFGTGRQHFDHHTVHDHRARNTHSNLEMRTVLTDRSRSAYTGLIRIGKDAPYSEAFQENRNLVMSPGAKADTIPELEIETDEVQCKHGATVGPMDEEHIFYLMSRGIPRQAALQMLVRGFVDSLLDQAPAGARELLEGSIAEKLTHIA